MTNYYQKNNLRNNKWLKKGTVGSEPKQKFKKQNKFLGEHKVEGLATLIEKQGETPLTSRRGGKK
jgi:hypothetical protein